MPKGQPILEIHDLKNYLGNQWIHNGVNLTINKGEIIAIVGASGGGKTVLLNSILMLQRPTSGSIKVFGVDLMQASAAEAVSVRQRWGVLFQYGALFSSLTVLENIMFPLRQFSHLHAALQNDIGLLKLALVGLPMNAAHKYPAEISGGMIKRVALARAIALDPEILFLDEPTSGLDPKSADELNDLILNLRESLGITVIVNTHNMDFLWRVSDRVAFLGEGKLIAASPVKVLVKNSNPMIQEYFSGVKKLQIS